MEQILSYSILYPSHRSCATRQLRLALFHWCPQGTLRLLLLYPFYLVVPTWDPLFIQSPIFPSHLPKSQVLLVSGKDQKFGLNEFLHHSLNDFHWRENIAARISKSRYGAVRMVTYTYLLPAPHRILSCISFYFYISYVWIFIWHN